MIMIIIQTKHLSEVCTTGIKVPKQYTVLIKWRGNNMIIICPFISCQPLSPFTVHRMSLPLLLLNQVVRDLASNNPVTV